jgi:predicted nucleotide-binding protein
VDIDEVCAFLDQRGISFEIRDIDHGKQIKAKTGEVVNFYETGSIVIGGKKSIIKTELEGWKQSGFAPSTIAQAAGDTLVQSAVDVTKQVFVVYGHDQAARDGLELLLRRMKLEPIVLANLPAGGDTIIEKLEKYLGGSGNVGFACVLLTPDDEGYVAGQEGEKKYRARQNVILELGMVLTRLGRPRVAILTKESVEKPSDISGLLYISFKERIDEVKSQLFRELKAAGYAPDTSAL